MRNEKKKLLIVNNNLETGGVQRSLVNLLNEIKDIYDITLFVFSHKGDYRNSIPEQVNVMEASPLLRLLGMSQAQTISMGYAFYFIRATLALYAKIFGNRWVIRSLVSTQERLLEFDVAISFLHNSNEKLLYGGCNEFVLNRVTAEEKMTFLHCDFLKYGGNTLGNRTMYCQFDKIATVSEACQQSFLEAVPELASKTHCVTNCHNYDEIISKASDNSFEYPADRLNIVTVARLSPEKGILRGIEVISKLVKEGYSISWHIVGDGIQRGEITDRIRQSDASAAIYCYGSQENLYRFMKNADLFLLPSYHEAAPMVIEEAKCLKLPILTTQTTSSKEMVVEGKEGYVCENSERGLYQILRYVLDNPQELYECKTFLEQQQYSNKKALSQFFALIGDVN